MDNCFTNYAISLLAIYSYIFVIHIVNLYHTGIYVSL